MTVPMDRHVFRMISPMVFPEQGRVSGDHVPPIIMESGSRPEASISAAIRPQVRASSKCRRISVFPPAEAHSGNTISRSVPAER